MLKCLSSFQYNFGTIINKEIFKVLNQMFYNVKNILENICFINFYLLYLYHFRTLNKIIL